MNNTSQSSSTQPRAFVASSAWNFDPWTSAGSWNDGISGPSNWYLDSAATNHITNDVQNLDSYQSYFGNDQVTVGNGASLPIRNTGKGLLPTPHFSFRLNKVLHIPTMSTNLLSVNQLTKDNKCTVTFDSDSFVVQDKTTKQVLHQGANVNGLYQFPLSSTTSTKAFLTSTAPGSASVSSEIWHQRLGHPSLIKFQHITKHLNIPFKRPVGSLSCTSCCVAKSHRLPFKLSTTSVNQPLSLIHSDVWGPFNKSKSTFRFYVLFIDDYSKFTWLYPLHYKSEVFDKFVEFKNYAEKQFSTSLKIFRTDGGTEYVNHKMDQFLVSQGVVHQHSCPYTSAQNGIAERKHRHITDSAIALLYHSGVPLKYWFEAVATATFLINRMPSFTLQNLSPYEVLFQTPPDYSSLKVFGCQCFPWLRPYVSHKLQPKSIPCVFLGYHPSVKGYRCLDPHSGKIYLSRHVVFHEHIFPYKFSSSPSPPESLSQVSHFFWPPNLSSIPNSTQVPSSADFTSFSSSLIPPSVSLSSSSFSESPSLVSSKQTTSEPVSSSPPSTLIPSGQIPIGSLSIALPLPPCKAKPVYIPHPMQTRSKTAPTCLTAVTTTPSSSASVSSSITEPLTVKEALQSSQWSQAMLDEYQALQKQGTWSLVPLPPHKHAIGCKWVFKLKRNSDGTIARYKARLVAKGYLQEEGIDYFETFSPVAKQPTIRILLSLALSFNWPIRQLDISNAFLHGTLEEEVYMVQPPGFISSSQPHMVCKLHKALYGLKQAPRAWYSTFSSFLLSHGFLNSHCDSSLFLSKTSSSILIVLVYVDDILVTGSDLAAISLLIHQMQGTFSMKDRGLVSYFLGISVQSHDHGYFLSQSKYAGEILAKAGMVECKSCATPIALKSVSSNTSNTDSLPFGNPSLYRSIVGALQYLTITRPELAYAVNQACQHMASPTIADFTAIKRLLRYVKGTIDHGLSFTPGSFTLQAFSDSDWAGDSVDRRSTSGYCIFLGNNLISWSAKKQPTVSRSSTEAEYRALAHSVAEMSWLQMLLRDLSVSAFSAYFVV